MSDIESRKDIEARLDRSLRQQVQAPRLDARFDAAVWVRIAQEEAKVAQPAVQVAPSRAVRASRWFALVNVLGIAATLGVAFYFALGSLGGIDPPTLNVGLDVPLPSIADETADRAIDVLGYVLGGAALAFGLSFTALGRRLRNALS
jgi:hypothetical protein